MTEPHDHSGYLELPPPPRWGVRLPPDQQVQQDQQSAGQEPDPKPAESVTMYSVLRHPGWLMLNVPMAALTTGFGWMLLWLFGTYAELPWVYSRVVAVVFGAGSGMLWTLSVGTPQWLNKAPWLRWAIALLVGISVWAVIFGIWWP